MAKIKLRQETQRAVTARFPLGDFANLASEAESRGTTIADVLRIAWASYCEQQETKQLFARLEARLIRQMFEVCAATSRLDDKERTEAMSEFKERMQELRK